MSYRLREGLSYCEVDGGLVFLDLEADRYFRLADRFSRALAAALGGERQSGTDVEALVAKRILVQSPAAFPYPPDAPITVPTRSALEQRNSTPRLHVLTVLEATALVFSTQMQLRNRRLARILGSLVAYRDRMTAGRLSTVATPTAQLLATTARFRQSRAYVPIEPCCLLDSIAMVRFLARRRIPAAITFGVTLDPFAAHCWVQSGDWVLNDTVGNVVAHTPIRRV